jgi:hypothetical protein
MRAGPSSIANLLIADFLRQQSSSLCVSAMAISLSRLPLSPGVIHSTSLQIVKNPCAADSYSRVITILGRRPGVSERVCVL